MRGRKSDTILNVTVGDHEYTPDEILSFPTSTMYKKGVKAANFRYDQKRGVAFYADIAGNLITDNIGYPRYTLLKEQNAPAKTNDFLSKVAAATAAAEEANQTEQEEKGNAGKTTKKKREKYNPKRDKQSGRTNTPKQPQKPKKQKKTAKISIPDNDLHGASKKDVQANQMDCEQRNCGIVCFILGFAATLVILGSVIAYVYLKAHGML